uniref:ATP synthase protein 8 n=1 Tax=Lecanora markjohnstonii TaxID=2217878 RepID=A0A2Z4KCM6_9LECA|nr:ATPase subunit 8 [Lecanora markjohnstonii]
MPQLVPFYFLNQITFAFTLLILMIYIFSKYILAIIVRLFATRVFITKL